MKRNIRKHKGKHKEKKKLALANRPVTSPALWYRWRTCPLVRQRYGTAGEHALWFASAMGRLEHTGGATLSRFLHSARGRSTNREATPPRAPSCSTSAAEKQRHRALSTSPAPPRPCHCSRALPFSATARVPSPSLPLPAEARRRRGAARPPPLLPRRAPSPPHLAVLPPLPCPARQPLHFLHLCPAPCPPTARRNSCKVRNCVCTVVCVCVCEWCVCTVCV